MIGVVILAHEELRRTVQVARHMADSGCKVALHVDARVKPIQMARVNNSLQGHENVIMVDRRKCHWGTFSLVDAAMDATRLLLDAWPDLTHVCQISGACLPIKPIPQLAQYLSENPGVDFIESVPAGEKWVVDGLSEERFSLVFPVSFRKHQLIFDKLVLMQRSVGFHRKMPDGLEPMLGSQWWCLSRETLSAILNSPKLDSYAKFFRWTWIPDESFFQTLVPRYSQKISNENLHFVQFDPQGKPFVLYDDHKDMLLNVDAFFARKIWHGASDLYDTFLGADLEKRLPETPDPTLLAKRFERADWLHRRGRTGLISQGRHPGHKLDDTMETARPYVAFEGLEQVLPNLRTDLNRMKDVVAHGYLFAPDRVEFVGDAEVYTGNLSANVAMRDHKPLHFLSKLIWVERERTQCFLHDFAADTKITRFLLTDPKAHILRLQEAWLIDLFDTWKQDPVARSVTLAQDLDDTRRRAEDLEAQFDGAEAHVATLTLVSLLQGGVTLSDHVAANLPRDVGQVAFLSGARTPVGFVDFVQKLVGIAPDQPGLKSLLGELRAHETRMRLLGRKT